MKYPRGQRRIIGRVVTALDRLLTEHPRDQATSVRSLALIREIAGCEDVLT